MPTRSEIATNPNKPVTTQKNRLGRKKQLLCVVQVAKGSLMAANRLFLPQNVVDTWLAEGRVRLMGDELKLEPQGHVLHLTSALHFKSEVAGGPDEHELVGKVKAMDAVAALSGEHCADSVVLGDNAYEVEEGFLAEPTSGVTADDNDQQPDAITRLFMEM